MNKNQRVKFTEIDEESSIYEQMGQILECNKKTLMFIERLSRKDAAHLLFNRQFQETYYGVTDTEDEETQIVYPKNNSPEGADKLFKLKKLKRYTKTQTDIKNNSTELLYVDKETETYYEPEASYFRKRKKDLKCEGSKYVYYKAVLLHDVTKYVKKEIELLEDLTTGIPNKNQLMAMLIDYISQAIARKESFSLTMLDLDHFKNINDTYGHPFGDSVLKALAQYVNSSIRHGENRTPDIMGRYGGEEFIFSLSNIDFENAVAKNQRICNGVATNLRMHDGIEIKLTCSMGMVHVDHKKIANIKPQDKEEIIALASRIIDEADINMYKSKKNGRNQVTVVKYNPDRDKDIEEK